MEHFVLCGGKIDRVHFWVGRVPCYNVTLVGILVGVKPMERKVVYTCELFTYRRSERNLDADAWFTGKVDDGTSVVDCRHVQAVPPKSKAKGSSSVASVGGFAELMKPVAGLGTFVKITGKMVAHYETREIVVSRIGLCPLSHPSQ